MARRIRLRTKPVKPERIKRCYVVSKEATFSYQRRTGEIIVPGYIDSVEDALEWCERAELDPADVSFEYDRGYYDDYTMYLAGYRMESEEEYEKRLEAWRKKLASYEAWYKENEQEIKAEKARRKAEERRAKRTEAEARLKKLEREAAKLKKELE